MAYGTDRKRSAEAGAEALAASTGKPVKQASKKKVKSKEKPAGKADKPLKSILKTSDNYIPKSRTTDQDGEAEPSSDEATNPPAALQVAETSDAAAAADAVSDAASDAGDEQTPRDVSFRIVTGSYEHYLLSLQVTLREKSDGTGIDPLFVPIFHFEAHTQSVKTLACSKRFLVSGGNDEHIKIYDIQKRRELGTLLEHNGSITMCRFTEGAAEGKWLLSAAADGRICLWRTKDWELLGTLKGHQGPVSDFAVHPSGRLALSVGTDRTLRLWNLMTAKKASVMKLSQLWARYFQPAEFVRWGDGGELFVVGFRDRLAVFRTELAEVVGIVDIPPKSGSVMCMDLYRDSEGRELIVTGQSTGKILMFSVSEIVAQYAAQEKQGTPEKYTVAPECELTGHAIRIKGIHLLRYFPSDRDEARGVNGRDFLISVSSDGKILVWDLAIRDQIAVFDSGERINCVTAFNDYVEKYQPAAVRSGLEVDTDYESEIDIEELKPKLSKKARKKLNKKKKNMVKVDIE